MSSLHDMNRHKRSYEDRALEHPSDIYYNDLVGPSTPYQWHEIEYTASINPSHGGRFAPTSAPVQYSSDTAMQFSPIDYTRHDYTLAATCAGNDTVIAQTSNLYHVGPFRYSDTDTASLSQESIYSRSTRIHSLTDSERRDSQTNSVMTGNDARRESEGFEMNMSRMVGEPKACSSQGCGSSSPCIDLSHLGSIEGFVPASCMTALSTFTVNTSGAANGNQEQIEQTTSPILHSPTSLEFSESNTAGLTEKPKSRRAARSKPARSGTSDDMALDKATKLRARQAHSLVERKYRDNLNLKISQLHQTLQNTRYGPLAATRSPTSEVKTEFFDEDVSIVTDHPQERRSNGSSPAPPKARKSDVLSEAMNYVNGTEVEMRHMADEILRLNARIETLERLVRCEDCSLMKQMVELQVQGTRIGSGSEPGPGSGPGPSIQDLNSYQIHECNHHS